LGSPLRLGEGSYRGLPLSMPKEKDAGQRSKEGATNPKEAR